MTTKTRQARKVRQAKLHTLQVAQTKAELEAQALAERIEDLEIDDVGGLPIPAQVEPEQKDDWGMQPAMAMPIPPSGGATSFDEFLSYRDAQEKAEAIHFASYTFQDIVTNILANETITDKAKAISVAATELQALLKNPEPLMKEATEEIKTEEKAPTQGAGKEKTGFVEWLRQQWEAFTKAGARHSGADLADMQTVHDIAKRQGAACEMKVLKGTDGQFYAFGYPTNNFRDRDYAKHPQGEIITEAAHKEFNAYLDVHPNEAPELWCWHTPGTSRKSRATWWDYSDGFMCYLWPLTEQEAKGFDEGETVAMSHGFYVLERNAKEGTINKYRSFEGSDLPPEVAANPYTDLEIMRKESTMFDERKREYLVKRLGAERVKELEAHPAEMSKALAELGVEHKEAAPAEAPPEKAIEDLKVLFNLDGLQKVITDLQAQNKTLSEQVTALTATIGEVKKSDDEKVAEVLTPKIRPMQWGHQATKDTKNVITEEQVKEKGIPAGSWVKQLVESAQ